MEDLFFRDAVMNDVDLCYYAHLPNRHMDLDNSDNFTCLEFFVNSEEVFSDDIDVAIYPNPAHEFLNIKFENYFSENMQLSIVNNYGQTVKSIFLEKEIAEKRIEMNDWPSGVYYLKIIMKENILTKRFVKK